MTVEAFVTTVFVHPVDVTAEVLDCAKTLLGGATDIEINRVVRGSVGGSRVDESEVQGPDSYQLLPLNT